VSHLDKLKYYFEKLEWWTIELYSNYIKNMIAALTFIVFSFFRDNVFKLANFRHVFFIANG